MTNIDVIETYTEAYKVYEPQGFLKKIRDFKVEEWHISPLWALCTSHALLTTFTPYCDIETDESYTPINVDFENLSKPSTGKTKPINRFDKPVIQKAGDCIHKDLIVPSSFSKEGFVTSYSSKITAKKKKRKVENTEAQLNTEIHEVEQDADTEEQEEKIELPKVFKNPLIEYTQYGGLMHLDECQRMHRGIEVGTGYEADKAEFLSMLYDGELEKRTTNLKGLQHNRPIFANVLLTGTIKPTFSVWKKKDALDNWFGNGYGNRIWYVYDMIRPRGERTTYHRSYDVKQYQQNYIRETASDLVKLYNYNVLGITVSDDLITQICNWETILLNYADDISKDSDLHSAYFGRQKVGAFKLMAHHCISRNYADIVAQNYEKFDFNGHTLEANEYDMNYAFGRIMVHYGELCRMLEDIKKAPAASKEVETAERYFDRIIEILENAELTLTNGQKYMVSGVLQNKSSIFYDTFDKLMTTMVQNEMVYRISKNEMSDSIRKKLGIKSKPCTIYSLEPFNLEN